MRARSALFDVYGDHLRARGNQAPVAALVRMLAPVGISAPAVRTAISRMVMEGWLAPVQLDGVRGYRATERANRRLDEAADRIYHRTTRRWDGTWHLVFVTPPEVRTDRMHLRADLSFVGYAELAENVWVSPYERGELGDVLDRAGATARTARAHDFTPPPIDAWDLSALRAAYSHWQRTAGQLVATQLAALGTGNEGAFAARFHLVHEWRKFLFADPGLPDELLPEDWPGREATAMFTAEADRLKPGADRFVASCLGG